METEIKYNQEFDKEHYPITEKDSKDVDTLIKIFQLPNGTAWIYDATIHGKIFSVSFKGKDEGHHRRFYKDTIKSLSEMDGFRWVERHGDVLSVGMEHNK